MPCPVCPHPLRHDLDQARLAENLTFATLSRKYGPSLSPPWRHKKHLQEKMRQAENHPKNPGNGPSPLPLPTHIPAKLPVSKLETSPSSLFPLPLFTFFPFPLSV